MAATETYLKDMKVSLVDFEHEHFPGYTEIKAKFQVEYIGNYILKGIYLKEKGNMTAVFEAMRFVKHRQANSTATISDLRHFWNLLVGLSDEREYHLET